jgi:prepilin-type N-terminal cleavage/methylation domain-containing protein
MASKVMRTILATGNKGTCRNGFTLIELSIAVFIIAIIMAVSVPSFIRSYNASLLNSTGRTFITACQLARLNAVLHQQKTTFYIDMDKHMMWLTQGASAKADDTDSVESSGQVLKTIEVSPRIALVSAQVADEPIQQRGQVQATFYPNGTCDAFTVTFRGSEKKSGLAIVVDPVTSRAIPWPVKL